MGNFTFNTIEELLFDASFRNWVKASETADAEFWNNWIELNPDKLLLVNNAKAIIYALHIDFQALPPEQLHAEIEAILKKSNDLANSSFDEETDDEQTKNILPLKRWILSAAAIIILAFLSWLFIQLSTPKAQNGYLLFSTNIENGEIQKINNTTKPLAITLSDSSVVHLAANSELSYSKDFNNGSRDVYLEGEAYFEVKKSTTQPFFVYTEKLVTKVLGTSFKVTAWKSNKNTIVTVKTGKVSVFKSDNLKSEDQKSKNLGGIVLTTNQQVVYSVELKELNKDICEKPLMVTPSKPSELLFESTPIPLVFKKLQDTYEILIVFDEDSVADCSLSANLGGDNLFYDKINLICRAINATWEKIDGNIVITSKGCG
jgi:transmembrane sensor